MYKRIPKEFISDIIDRVNIIDYVSQFATLKRVGQRGEQVAKCPLPSHKDDTPSFYVNEHKQTYKCHGCGSGGGIVDFIKDYHGHEFVPAIEEIADFLGVKIPYESRGSNDKNFISYSDIYKQIYLSAQSLAFEIDQVPDGICEKTIAESGIIPVKPSTIRNVAKRLLKDQKELADNVLSNLPDKDETFFMLPIKTQFSESIESLYLFNGDFATQLPSKPTKSYNKLVYNSHRFSKDKPKSGIYVFPSPDVALHFQNSFTEDAAVIASVDSSNSISKKVFKTFENEDGFLSADNLVFVLDITAPTLTPTLEHLLRISAKYAARTSFHFYDKKPNRHGEYSELTYIDAFVTLCEEKSSALDLNSDECQAKFAKYIEYLLGGDEISSNINNYIREKAYETVGRPDLLSQHYNRHYTKPSSHVLYESLAVPDSSLKDIKKLISDLVVDSMDLSPEDFREEIKTIKSKFTNDEPELLSLCLNKLNLLSYKSSFIKMDMFIDELTAEERKAYMEPRDDDYEAFKI